MCVASVHASMTPVLLLHVFTFIIIRANLHNNCSDDHVFRWLCINACLRGISDEKCIDIHCVCAVLCMHVELWKSCVDYLQQERKEKREIGWM